MRRFGLGAMFLVVFVMMAGEARADRRIFGWTYPYMTLPQGVLELEHYLDIKLNGYDDPSTDKVERDWNEVDWQHQVEFEYGITDKLDFGFYNVFSQKPFGNFGYKGAKVRSRYRFADEGVLAIDPAIYVEFAYYGAEIKIEQMLILSKKLGKFELSLNIKGEQELVLDDNSWEFEVIPMFGAGYHINNHVAVGIEYYGKAKFKEGDFDYFASYLGPTVSFAGRGFFWTLAAQPQLGTDKDRAAVQIRSLFGARF